MKLIVRDYLRTLKEDRELDAILVDLLSELGMNVISRPQKGVAQHGVDLVAVGKLRKEDPETVYLVTVKAGNINRVKWQGDPQALSPSLEDIVDVYVRNHIPKEHESKPIVICCAFGGEIEQNVQESYDARIRKYQSQHPGIGFQTWNGDWLASMICDRFLNAKLFVGSQRKLLVRSLATVDEPEIALEAFRKLVRALLRNSELQDSVRKWNRAGRTVNLCLGLLIKACRDAGNLETALLGAEACAIEIWGAFVKQGKKRKKIDSTTLETLSGTNRLLKTIYIAYLSKLEPLTSYKYHLSLVVKGNSPLDINLRLFDLLGKVSSFGLMMEVLSDSAAHSDIENKEQLRQNFKQLGDFLSRFVCNAIRHNPTLLHPIKDDFCIEIATTALFLHSRQEYRFLHWWLFHMVDNIHGSLKNGMPHPCIFQSYQKLLDFYKDPKPFRKTALPSSELIPTLALIALSFNWNDIYERIVMLIRQDLSDTDFQLWFPEQNGEVALFMNETIHGVQLTNLPISNPKQFVEEVKKCCEKYPVEFFCRDSNVWLIFLACRHYRIPVPVHFWNAFLSRQENKNSVSNKGML